MRELVGVSEIKEAYSGESVPDLVAMAMVLARRSRKEGWSVTAERTCVGEVAIVDVGWGAGVEMSLKCQMGGR